MTVSELFDSMKCQTDWIRVLVKPESARCYEEIYNNRYLDAATDRKFFGENGEIGKRKVIGWKITPGFEVFKIYVSRNISER